MYHDKYTFKDTTCLESNFVYLIFRRNLKSQLTHMNLTRLTEEYHIIFYGKFSNVLISTSEYPEVWISMATSIISSILVMIDL